jgi:dihydroorotate dehydrogenase electron transfer subunit
MTKKSVDNFTVVSNKKLNYTNYCIKLQSVRDLPEFLPGQFVNVEIKNNENVFLRRPFSVFDVNQKKRTVSLLVKILGKGSKSLTEIKVGEKINMVFPLGKSFTLPKRNEKVLLIGGGSGVAPMLFLAKKSNLPKSNLKLIIGARKAEDHINIDAYQEFGEIHFTTEDGSMGEKGFVTQHSIFQNNLKRFDRIYACGPDAMMKAIAKKAKEAGIFCEVSLENLMACGFGVCLCCIEPTTRGNVCICTEGPVFNINELKW